MIFPAPFGRSRSLSPAPNLNHLPPCLRNGIPRPAPSPRSVRVPPPRRRLSAAAYGRVFSFAVAALRGPRPHGRGSVAPTP